jgi:transposase
VRALRPRTRVRIWFQDEARFGQQGTLTAVWAMKGSRPTVARQHGQKSIWVFAAVEPATGGSMVIPYSEVNTETTQAFLDAAAQKWLRRREHAVMILDGAGWHCSHKLRWPRRINQLFLSPYSPELNPVERLWHWFREHRLSNRTYADEQALVAEAIRSHRTLRREDIRSNLPHQLGHALRSSVIRISPR